LIPFVLRPSDACGHYGFTCPVEKSAHEKLAFSLPVLKTYPKLSLSIVLKMLDERRKLIICVQFPASITDA